jgi:hypothetical protein
VIGVLGIDVEHLAGGKDGPRAGNERDGVGVTGTGRARHFFPFQCRMSGCAAAGSMSAVAQMLFALTASMLYAKM